MNANGTFKDVETIDHSTAHGPDLEVDDYSGFSVAAIWPRDKVRSILNIHIIPYFRLKCVIRA